MEITESLGKTFIKNGYIFSSKFFLKDSFYFDLRKLFDKWPSPYQEKGLGIAWRHRDIAEINTKNAKAYTQRQEFINGIDKNGKLSELYSDIESFIKKHEFGGEWFLTITDYLISGWLHPPMRNLNIREDERRVVLILNPDTSLDDIGDVWPIIKEAQNRLWPEFKKENYSKKMFKNLFIAIQDMEERGSKNGKRLEAVEYQEDKRATDLDIVARIWNDEEGDIPPIEDDKRNVANLRQIRKRFRSK